MLGIVQLLGVLEVAGVELLLQSQTLVLNHQPLLVQRLSMGLRLPLKLRAISPSLDLPYKCHEQAHADQTQRT